MSMDRQHIHPAFPWRGSSANAMSTQPNDTRSVDMCPKLHHAVCRGRTEEVLERLVPLHGAAAADKATGIIQHGRCDILEVTAAGNTVLHLAAEKGRDELIQELYIRFREKVKSLLSRQNSALDTPLHCAARAGSDKAVVVLVRLARECGESILGCKNEAGDTALHLAARHGHAKAVEALVSAATAVAAKLNNAGVSPLYLAVMSGSVEALKAITTCREASSVGPGLQNALHAAVFQRKAPKMVELLLKWRKALADEVDCNGSSPLHLASSDGDCKLVAAILRDAPSRTVYKKDLCGLSALHVAAQMGHHRVAELLLESCPDAAELRDNNGRTFLHAAANEKRSSVVSLAIKKFKDSKLRGLLDAQDRKGDTPLHLAVAAGAPGVVEALLRKGKVRVDVFNNDGKTPLDLAAESTSYFTMVSLVVMLGAFKAQTQPQRQDRLKPWDISNIMKGIEKTFNSLAVVAVLIAIAALAAGFNGDNGKANLERKPAFRIFPFLDTLAMATSMVAAILLVYGKSFVASLHCMWVSLNSLMLAFNEALVSVMPANYRFGLMVLTLKLEHRRTKFNNHMINALINVKIRIRTWIRK
ncbi:uncharacterized protein LOC133900362 [Phragmites australis]|uniref:uncharacterized protein LOC133900362 n=1 Tax=Phragmites australis TaxID=29695 RepID=UPI002D772670|nr:uncharacterized protein LOC133900362 [Phragmites australis]